MMVSKTSPRRAISKTSSAQKATRGEADIAAPPVEETVTATESATPELKKKELIELVVIHSGVKKKFAKPVVEAMLAVLGEAIAGGRELNMQPLGKVKVTNEKSVPNGKVMNTRIRQSDQARRASDGVPSKEAEASDAETVKETLADPAQ